MKIVGLTAQNVKKVKAVEIKPNGDLVVVGGNNAQGKSSVLDSIVMALGGKKALGKKPVREGEEKATIVVDLDDFVVTRTITKSGGGSLKIANKDGAVYQSPQSILDALCSKLTFDPLAFMNEKPKAQRDMLQGIVGLDFSELDVERQAVYQLRRDVNRDLKNAQATLESMEYYHDAPKKKIDVSALSEELSNAHRNNQDRAVVLNKRASLREKVEYLENELTTARNALKEYEQQEAPEEINTEDIQQKINDADATNYKVQANQARAEVKTAVLEHQNTSDGLSQKLAALDQKKATEMKAAKFPVEGLAFDEGGISFRGIPFESCSSAEQLKVSVAMGIAMNPKLKVLLIKDGSLLDDDSLAMIAKMVSDANAQIWIERVGKGEECSVIIEDGEIEKGEE